MTRSCLVRSLAAPLALLFAAFTSLAAQHPPRPYPAGVTDSSIAWGRRLFHGSANCAGCHGVEARGTTEGPPLSGALWLHGPGTYEWLVEQIREGIPAHHTYTGKPMPMRGWSNMPDADVRAVAAYVWAITHPPRPVRSTPRPTAAPRRVAPPARGLASGARSRSPSS